MKALFFMMSAILCFFQSAYNQDHLDVEGHARIRGKIDISHMDDSTSVIIGTNAGINTNFTSNKKNTFIGVNAGKDNNTSGGNSFFGYNAGLRTNASNNSFFGASAGEMNTTMSNNCFFGVNTGKENTGGSNSFFGVSAGFHNDGTENSFFGAGAGTGNETGYFNSFFGSYSGNKNTSGYFNVFMGTEAGFSNTNGFKNVFIGIGSGSYNLGGDMNTFVGFNSGVDNVSGNMNTYVGNEASNKDDANSLDKAIAIGHNAKVACDNCAVIGGVGVDAVRVGVGVDSPTTVLMLLESGAVDPVGITQNQKGGPSTMELTTLDDSSRQATRILMRGGQDAADIEFYYGPRGGETLSMFIKGSNGRVGINTNTLSQKLDVDGNARFRSVGSGAFMSNLNLTSDGTLTTNTSNARLKTDIQTIKQALAKTLALRGVNYHWISDTAQNDRIGLIAQEVEAVVPEVVFTNPADGYKGVRYQELCALLVEAIKEQQQEIRTMEEEYRQLESDLAMVKEQLNQLFVQSEKQDLQPGN